MALTWSDYGQGSGRRKSGGGLIAGLALGVVAVTVIIWALASPKGDGEGSPPPPPVGSDAPPVGGGAESTGAVEEVPPPVAPAGKIPGEEELEDGRFSRAVSKLKAFLKEAPAGREPRALVLLGQAQRGAKDPKAAGETFRGLLAKYEMRPEAAEALYHLSFMEADPETSEAYLVRAIAPLYARTPGAALAGGVLGDRLWDQDVAGAAPNHKTWELVRRAYTRALLGLEGERRQEVVTRLRRLNKYLVFSKAECTGAEFYTVRPGDSVSVIARRKGKAVTIGSIRRMNGLDKKATIRPGESLKILHAPCFIEVNKGKYRLTAYLADYFFGEYTISLGSEETPTPPGTYEIEKKDYEPIWYYKGAAIRYGDPRNILGTRWMGFKNKPGASRLGIHGTTEPKTIGTMVSHGCIRMLNQDVEELCDFALIGTLVEVRD